MLAVCLLWSRMPPRKRQRGSSAAADAAVAAVEQHQHVVVQSVLQPATAPPIDAVAAARARGQTEQPGSARCGHGGGLNLLEMLVWPMSSAGVLRTSAGGLVSKNILRLGPYCRCDRMISEMAWWSSATEQPLISSNFHPFLTPNVFA